MSYPSKNEMQDEMQQDFPASIQDATLATSSVRASKQQKWMSMKEEIYHLYIMKGLSLNEVMHIMSHKHYFKASARQWKERLKTWGFQKRLKSSEAAFIVAKAKKRAQESAKNTAFFHRGRAIPRQRIQQIQRRMTQQYDVSPTIETPPGISYHTPPPESPEPWSLQYVFQERNLTPTGFVAFAPTPHPQEVLTDGNVARLPLKEANRNKEVTHTYKENEQTMEASAQDTHARKVASDHVVGPFDTFRTGSLSDSSSLYYDLQETEGVLVKGDVPFTDSGYKSAPNLDNSPNSQPILEKSPRPFIINSSATGGSRGDNDAKTTYSIGTTVDPGYARKYIIELCNDIYSKLRQSRDTINRCALTTILPELITAFAIKLCHDSASQTSQMNREIMYFIHKRHREIAAKLEAMFNLDDEDEPNRDRGHLEDMSILDKMNMWSSKAGQDHLAHPNAELFEGVQDDDEDPIDQSDLSTYQKNILDSPAYELFLGNVAKESILKLESPQQRIRQQILDKLPTGTISKHRTPKVYEVTFDLEWQYTMEKRLQHELLEESKHPIRPGRSSVILTGSPTEAQGLTIKQYLSQTWPTSGFQLLNALGQATTSPTKRSYVILPENTQLETTIFPSHLVVKITGPAYPVANCGEQLAWIVSALLSNPQNISRYCLPLITSFQINAPSSALLEYKGRCNFDFELTQLGTSDESSPGIQNFSRDLLGENTIILGFPIRRRPEGYPGLELSFDTLLLYLEAPKAEIFILDVFIKGSSRVLKLIKHTEDVFLWRLDHSLADYSSCCPDYHSKAIAYEDYSSLDCHALEAGRHILSKCADNAAPPKGPGWISSRDLVDTKKTKSHFVTGTNSTDGPGFLSHNLTIQRTMGGLSAVSESQNNETALSSPSNRSAHSVIENDPWTPRSVNLGRWELLSQGSNMLSTVPHSSPTMESLRDSLDSDMFSISDSSDDFELLDPQEPVYPILNNILHELLAGFRTATQYQASPGEGGENSGPVASTTESSQPGASSRPNQKRNLLPNEEDDTGEDGSHPPPTKRIKLHQGTKLQKSFACPFLKWGPTKYSSCCVNVKKLSSISYVKQHLIKKHTPERYCQICQAASFTDDNSLERHINAGKCTRRDRTMLDGISYQQRSRLSRKSTPNATKEDQWFAIWDILFAAHPRPNTVYMDIDLTREMLQLHEYFTSRGPAVIRERLESDPVWRDTGITEEQSGVHLERLIAQGFNTWFEDWLSNGRSASISPQRLGRSSSSSNAQQSQYETLPSSLVDSGVVMGSPSSREAGASGREILPEFRASAMGFTSQPLAADARARSPSPVPDDAAASPQTHMQSPPFISFGSSMGVQQNPEDENHAFEPEPLNDFDFDKFLADVDMPGYLPHSSQEFWDGGPSEKAGNL